MVANAYSFKILGTFENVDLALVPITDYNGNTTGFLLPDGRSVNLVMALEVMSPEGDPVGYVNKASEMTSLGLDLLNYDSLTFSHIKE